MAPRETLAAYRETGNTAIASTAAVCSFLAHVKLEKWPRFERRVRLSLLKQSNGHAASLYALAEDSDPLRPGGLMGPPVDKRRHVDAQN
jgi:hypothetical protein